MSSGKNNKKQDNTSTSQPIAVDNVTNKPAQNDAQLPVKEETLRWVLTIFCSLAVYLVVAFIIRKVYHPDISIALKEAQKILIEPGSARPEPVEAMLVRSGIIIISLGLLGFYSLFSRLSLVKELARGGAFLIIAIVPAVLIAITTWLDFTALNPFAQGGSEVPQNSRDLVGKTNFDFYFEDFFLGKYLLLYTFILVPALVCLFFFGIKKYDWERKKTFKLGTSVVGYGVLGLVLVASVAMHVFYFPYSFENKYNLDAVYYSMTQVYSGLPMLVNNFTNTYGLYPQFMNILFHFIGLSVFKFSLVCGLLIGLSFMLNYYALKEYVQNKVILFLGIFSVIFFPFLNYRMAQNFDAAFALYPIRYIIPSSLLFLVTIYLKKKSNLIYWATTVIMTFFILWNPEIGMVSYISWVAFNIFKDFYTQQGAIDLKKILLHLVASVAVLVTAFGVYSLCIDLFYGAWPNISTLFSTITVFSKVGASLLPMTLIHPWNLVVMVLIAGFVYAIRTWCKKAVTPKAAVVALLTVISLGFFMYFQGRSHNWPFSISTGFCLMLLTILTDELWAEVKKSNILPLAALFVACLFLMSFSFFSIVAGTDRISELVSQDDDKAKQQDEQLRIESNNEFLAKNSKEKENIYVFTARQYQGLYFDGNKRRSAFNPGIIEFFLNSDLERLTTEVRDSSFNIFIEPNFCNYYFLNRPFSAMAATYEVKDTNKTMALLVKRKSKLPAQSFLVHGGEQLFHRKYTDDTAGINARINDGCGVNPVNINTEFSVEVLFKPEKQAYQYATLVGNMNDSTGFIIANIINSPNYFFGVNGKGTGAAIPGNDWAYCVMNVYTDHMEVYVNGNLASTFPLPKPFKNSPEKLFAGNLGFMRYYIGPIAEVAIANRSIDKAQIAMTWDGIKQALVGK